MRLCSRALDIDDLLLSLFLGSHLLQFSLVSLSFDSVTESILLFYQWSELRAVEFEPALDLLLYNGCYLLPRRDYFFVEGVIICVRIDRRF